MGNFYTSTQILNDELLSKEDFLKKFRNMMKRDGYETCEDDDEGEIRYSFSFSEEKENRWATLYSESYEEGNQTSKRDTARISKMLGTFCINTTVIDSDCAILDLYDRNGNNADTLVMGRADDYFGDNIPEPEKSLWEPLLNKGVSWEQFFEIVHGDYVFVEDGLARLSTTLNSGSMFNEVFESECSIAFEKAGPKITVTSSSSEKKLTVSSAFKKVYEEKLKPIGFVRVNNPYNYFIRNLNDEIISVITMVSDKIGGIQKITVLGGIATIHRKQIDFSISPESGMNYWLFGTSSFYSRQLSDNYRSDYSSEIASFTISNDCNNCELLFRFEKSFEYVNKWTLPVLNEVTDTLSAVEYFLKYSGSCLYFKEDAFQKGNYLPSNESLMLARIKQVDSLIQNYEDYLVRYNKFMDRINQPLRKYDVYKAVSELRDRINIINSDEKYIRLLEKWESDNIKILCEL